MNTNNKSKKEILKLLNSLIESCEEGISGDWDSSIPNGIDGFLAMIEALEDITVYVNNKE
jgi:hypothetical protein